MEIIHCHACGKELGELPRWHLQDQTFYSPECMFPGIGTMTWEKERSARIAALEADLAEALDALEEYARFADLDLNGRARSHLDINRRALRIMAKHGKFRITRDDDWTEGEWVE